MKAIKRLHRIVPNNSGFGKRDRFVARADEKLTAFLELETAIRWH
jgi:hypothetical protein